MASTETSTQRTGSCLCGALKYTLSGEPMKTSLCHCRNCSKASGSAFGFVSVYRADQYQLTEPTPSPLTHYADSGTGSGGTLNRYFCSTCGSRMFIKPASMQGVIVVALGTLDDKSEAKITEEYFTDRKVKCIQATEGAKTWPGNPTEW